MYYKFHQVPSRFNEGVRTISHGPCTDQLHGRGLTQIHLGCRWTLASVGDSGQMFWEEKLFLQRDLGFVEEVAWGRGG